MMILLSQVQRYSSMMLSWELCNLEIGNIGSFPTKNESLSILTISIDSFPTVAKRCWTVNKSSPWAQSFFERSQVSCIKWCNTYSHVSHLRIISLHEWWNLQMHASYMLYGVSRTGMNHSFRAQSCVIKTESNITEHMWYLSVNTVMLFLGYDYWHFQSEWLLWYLRGKK